MNKIEAYNKPIKYTTVFYKLDKNDIEFFKNLVAELDYWEIKIQNPKYYDFDDTDIKLFGYENGIIKELKYAESQENKDMILFIKAVKNAYINIPVEFEYGEPYQKK